MKQKSLVLYGAGGLAFALAVFASQASLPEETAAAVRAPKTVHETVKPQEIAKIAVAPQPIAPLPVPTVTPQKVEAPKIEKTTILPNGKVLIENKRVTLRYANGKTEERFVKITATPVQKPVKKVMRKKS